MPELNNNFAAFVVTYERPKVLIETITRILAQSYPPHKILVVDNSYTKETEASIKNSGISHIEYYYTGFNAGPAGGAKIGLEMLTNQGYEWIYWGDDNDPPAFEDCFERLLNLANSYPGKCGQVGAVGHLFDTKKGVLQRFSTDYLQENTYLDVDNVAGNMCKIVNSEVVKKGVLPDDKKFFGFEELDFDLRCKDAGYNLVVDCSLFLEYREKSNRLNFVRKQGKQIDEEKLWREYYSTRNLLLIFSEQKMSKAYKTLILRKLYKVITGFKYGLPYGYKNFKVIYKGLLHGIRGKSGYIDRQALL